MRLCVDLHQTVFRDPRVGSRARGAFWDTKMVGSNSAFHDFYRTQPIMALKRRGRIFQWARGTDKHHLTLVFRCAGSVFSRLWMRVRTYIIDIHRAPSIGGAEIRHTHCIGPSPNDKKKPTGPVGRRGTQCCQPRTWGQSMLPPNVSVDDRRAQLHCCGRTPTKTRNGPL